MGYSLKTISLTRKFAFEVILDVFLIGWAVSFLSSILYEWLDLPRLGQFSSDTSIFGSHSVALIMQLVVIIGTMLCAVILAVGFLFVMFDSETRYSFSSWIMVAGLWWIGGSALIWFFDEAIASTTHLLCLIPLGMLVLFVVFRDLDMWDTLGDDVRYNNQ